MLTSFCFLCGTQALKRKLGLLENDDMDKGDESTEKGAAEETLAGARIQGNYELIGFAPFLLPLYIVLNHLFIRSF